MSICPKLKCLVITDDISHPDYESENEYLYTVKSVYNELFQVKTEDPLIKGKFYLFDVVKTEDYNYLFLSF